MFVHVEIWINGIVIHVGPVVQVGNELRDALQGDLRRLERDRSQQWYAILPIRQASDMKLEINTPSLEIRSRGRLAQRADGNLLGVDQPVLSRIWTPPIEIGDVDDTSFIMLARNSPDHLYN